MLGFSPLRCTAQKRSHVARGIYSSELKIQKIREGNSNEGKSQKERQGSKGEFLGRANNSKGCYEISDKKTVCKDLNTRVWPSGGKKCHCGAKKPPFQTDSLCNRKRKTRKKIDKCHQKNSEALKNIRGKKRMRRERGYFIGYLRWAKEGPAVKKNSETIGS